jgi:hypothetical protein
VKAQNLIFAAIALGAMLFVSFAKAQTNDKPASADANYAQVIEKRTADIMAILALKDDAKAAAVHDAIVAQYRALRDWQAANGDKLKELARQKDAAAKEETANIMAARKALHDPFLAKLSAQLKPDQVEQVKDKMTYGKVEFTYRGYLAAYPNLTDEERAKILEMLKQAREEAMDGASAEEKTAIFKKYKGRINNYLAAQNKAKTQKMTPAPTVPLDGQPPK